MKGKTGLKVKQKKQIRPNESGCPSLSCRDCQTQHSSRALQPLPVTSLSFPRVNTQRTQEKERGQTRAFLKKDSPMPCGADGKALPGVCPTARRAHTKGSGEASAQAFLPCVLSSRHLRSLTLEVRHSATCPAGHSPGERHKKPQSRAELAASHCTSPRCRNLGWRHARQPGRCGGAAAANVLLHQPPAAPAPLATGGPDLGGKAKNCSRRRADAETGEPRTLHLPRSHGTTAREPLFDLWFLMLTKKSKADFYS